MSEPLSGPMLAPTQGKAKTLMVLLHGYGSDGNDLIALGRFWQASMPDTLFVAPNAPQPCDLNPAGFQWFPLDLDREMSRLAGGAQARPPIMSFLKSLWAQTGLGPSETFLVGFSQGAMMALDVGLRLEEAPLGIVSFSGGVIGSEQDREAFVGHPPVCLVHGQEDDVVPVSMSKEAKVLLDGMGIKTALRIEKGLAHSISVEGLGFALAFMRECMGEKPRAQ